MPVEGWMRAADWDREQTVEILRQAYTEGRLDTAELDQRTDTALRAKTLGELRGLIADIPRRPATWLPPEPWLAAPHCPPRRPGRRAPPVSMLMLLAAAACVLIGAALANTAAITLALTAGLGAAILRRAGR